MWHEQNFPVVFWYKAEPANPTPVAYEDLPYKTIDGWNFPFNDAMCLSGNRRPDPNRCEAVKALGGNVIVDSIDTLPLAKAAGIKLIAHSYWFPDDPDAKQIVCHIGAPTVGHHNPSTWAPGALMLWNVEYIEWMLSRYATDETLIGVNLSLTCADTQVQREAAKWMRANYPEVLPYASMRTIAHDFETYPVYSRGYWFYGPMRKASRREETTRRIYPNHAGLANRSGGRWWPIIPIISQHPDCTVTADDVGYQVGVAAASGADGVSFWQFNSWAREMSPSAESSGRWFKDQGRFLRDSVGPNIVNRRMVGRKISGGSMAGYLAMEGETEPDCVITVGGEDCDDSTEGKLVGHGYEEHSGGPSKTQRGRVRLMRKK